VHRVPIQAAHQFGVFTTRQAIDSGWSQSALTRALRSGKLVRLRRGAFALAQTVESGPALDRLRLGQAAVAGALRVPAGTVSHGAAVAVHGLPLLKLPGNPCITLAPPLRTREAALHVHRQPIPVWQRDPAYDFSITSVARSCIDFTREAGLKAGVVATDTALHAGLCTLADLEAVYATCKGRAGLPCGRQLFELLDGRSESPLETISRLALAPLEPSPRTQVTLRAPTGQFLGRVDFYWDELKVVGEADGRLKYTGEELWNEKLRQDRLTEHGFIVVRWGWAEANNPPLLQAKVSRALNRARQLRPGLLTAIVRPELSV
jgi:hypothetical protein